MPDRAALLMAVETFFEAGPPVPYAASDLKALLRALPEAGYNPKKCQLVAGPRTTKAGLDSALRRLPKLVEKGDFLLVLVVSRAFRCKGRGYLACADTLPHDPLETSLAVADLLAGLHKARCSEIAVLVDVDPLTPSAEFVSSVEAGLDRTELARLFDASPSCVGLLSAEPGERSYESVSLRRGIWRHHLIEALTGKARAALGPAGQLTAERLQAYLEEAVPRTIRRTYDSSTAQHPALFGEGNSAAIVADLSACLRDSEHLLDPARLRRVVFRAETRGKVKDLAGFRKSNAVPDRVNDWARKFVARLAGPDIKADLDRTFDAVRESFGYKRKDLDVSHEAEGAGSLRTPDFEYSICATIDPADPSMVVWRREVGRIADPGFIRGDGFAALFGHFDKLVFEFSSPVDVAGFVDRLEDDPGEGVKVNIDSEADRCEVKLAGFVGKVTIARQSLVIEGRSGSSAGLLDQFLAFLVKFGPMGEAKALPPAG